MKLYFLIVVMFLKSFSVLAQQRDRKIFHAGDNLSAYFTYRFPSFDEATILLKNGGTLKYKMNFNLLLCDMQFVNREGDTLEISKPGDINSIRFNNGTFFFSKNYFEILAASESVKLVVSRSASFEPVMIGAMGVASRLGTIQGFDSYNQPYWMPVSLRLNQDIYVYQQTDYFLITNNGEFIKANNQFPANIHQR